MREANPEPKQISKSDKVLRRVFIYTLADPRTPDNVRYVGKTEKTLEYRSNGHYKGSLRFKGARHNVNWIKSLAKVGLKPSIEVIEEVAHGECWKQAEKFWIVYLRSLGFKLTNSCEGGGGLSNPCKETRDKLRIAALNMPKSQRVKISRSVKKNLTPEFRKHLSNMAKARFARGDNKALMSNQFIGRKLSEAHKAKIGVSCIGHKPAKFTADVRSRISAGVKKAMKNPELRKRVSVGWFKKKEVSA